MEVAGAFLDSSGTVNDQEERRVAVDGVTLRYLEQGRGPPVVLLHGNGESAGSTWRSVIGDLARSHRVVAPDLLLADSSARDRGHAVRALASVVAGLLGAIGIERATLVGHSLGGLIALRTALRCPARIEALALVDSVGLGREVNPLLVLSSLPGYGELAGAWSATAVGAEQRALVRSFLLFARPDRAPDQWWDDQRRLARTPGFLAAALAAQRSVVGPLGQRERVLDELPRLAVPVLVVWADSDVVVPVTHARRAMDRLRDGRLAILPACGHLAPVERPKELVAALEGFLADGRAGGG